MIRTLTKGTKTISYDFERQKRKSLSVRITDSGQVIVKSPKWVTLNYVDEFLYEKFDWIIKKLDEVSAKTDRISKIYVTGSIVHSLGSDYLLIVNAGKRNKVTLKNNILHITATDTSEMAVRNQFIEWSNKQLKIYIEERVNYYLPIITHYSDLMQVKLSPINKISVKTVRSRWGSCSSKGSLNFSNKLAVAPLPLVDYVIVHEMCHLIYMNHSSDFWGAVAYIIPDYNLRRKLLKENGWQYYM